MEDLYIKRLDGVVCDEPVAAYFARSKYQHQLKVTDYLGVKEKNKYRIAVRQGDKELLDKINIGISTLKARGVDKELRLKWITP